MVIYNIYTPNTPVPPVIRNNATSDWEMPLLFLHSFSFLFSDPRYSSENLSIQSLTSPICFSFSNSTAACGMRTQVIPYDFSESIFKITDPKTCAKKDAFSLVLSLGVFFPLLVLRNLVMKLYFQTYVSCHILKSKRRRH